MHEHVASQIRKADRIVVLTGAGISTASGIPDFRSNTENKKLVPPLETILSRSYFYHDPVNFWESCEEIFEFDKIGVFKPNEGHIFVSDLEHKLNKKVTVITQNIDGLHNQAGSSEVLDIHGNLNRVYCPHCGTPYSFAETILEKIYTCSTMKKNKVCGGYLAPLFVLYGDAINHANKSKKRLFAADLLIVIGTSLQVSPANNFVSDFASRGKKIILINNEPTSFISMIDTHLDGDIVSNVKKIKEFLDTEPVI